jgi:hypothetical protein
LKYSGYDAASASPKIAEIMLRSQKFDLIVLSILSDFDLHRINNLADGADVLALDGFTSPSELLSLVAQRLDRRQRRANPRGTVSFKIRSMGRRWKAEIHHRNRRAGSPPLGHRPGLLGHPQSSSSPKSYCSGTEQETNSLSNGGTEHHILLRIGN